jgi:hypothetical protein
MHDNCEPAAIPLLKVLLDRLHYIITHWHTCACIVRWLIVDHGFMHVQDFKDRYTLHASEGKKGASGVVKFGFNKISGYVRIACMHLSTCWTVVLLSLPRMCTVHSVLILPSVHMTSMHLLVRASQLCLPNGECVCLLMNGSVYCRCGTYACGCYQATAGFQVLPWRRRMQARVALLLHGQITVCYPGVSRIIGRHICRFEDATKSHDWIISKLSICIGRLRDPVSVLAICQIVTTALLDHMCARRDLYD